MKIEALLNRSRGWSGITAYSSQRAAPTDSFGLPSVETSLPGTETGAESPLPTSKHQPTLRWFPPATFAATTQYREPLLSHASTPSRDDTPEALATRPVINPRSQVLHGSARTAKTTRGRSDRSNDYIQLDQYAKRFEEHLHHLEQEISEYQLDQKREFSECQERCKRKFRARMKLWEEKFREIYESPEKETEEHCGGSTRRRKRKPREFSTQEQKEFIRRKYEDDKADWDSIVLDFERVFGIKRSKTHLRALYYNTKRITSRLELSSRAG